MLRFSLGCLFLAADGAWAVPPPLVTFVVNDSNDSIDKDSLDGKCETIAGTCTLRAAVMQANDSGGDVTINLPAGNYIRGGPTRADGDAAAIST